MANRLTELGYEVVTLDINPRCRPTIVCDILRRQYRKQFNPGDFDLIFASPPCEMYSQARTTKGRDFVHADKLVKKSLEIIRYFQLKMWWMENPRNGHLRHRPFMQRIRYCDVDYCQFSNWGCKKPTRIWGGDQIAYLPSVTCNPMTCKNTMDGPRGRRIHLEQLGGNHMRFSTAEKGIIPQTLVDYLLQEGVYQGALGDRSCTPLHERYQVREPVVHDMLHKLGDLRPSVDAFADSGLHLFPKWWGPGSEAPDVFQTNWGENDQLLWCNPPFSKL